jgi:KUP system potassium uptake protein
MSHTAQRSNIRKLTLAAVGVVYGDIGTSPLYTTTLLACYVAIYNWDWPKPLVKGIGSLLLAIDRPFFCSNAVKIVDGG